MSPYPTPPVDVKFGKCSDGDVDYVCFPPEEIAKIANWADQVERWHEETKKCPYIKEYKYENTMYKIMESF